MIFMKIFSLLLFFVFVCLLISCSSDDGYTPSQKKEFKPSVDQSPYSKDTDTIAGEPIPPKGKG